MAKVCKSVLNYTLTPQMFSINILCFMSNFSFKGDTLYRMIPSGGIDLFIPTDSLIGGYNITGHTPAPITLYRHLFLVLVEHVPTFYCVNEICPPVSLSLVHTATPPANAQLRLLKCLRSSRCCC